MILRRADCGHYIPEDVPPAGEHHGSGQPIYLCDPCRDAARGHQRARVETKVVEPDRTEVTLKHRVDYAATDAGIERVGDPLDEAVLLSPHARGIAAARDGVPEEACPYADKRTRDAKEWLRGFREESERLNAHDERTDA